MPGPLEGLRVVDFGQYLAGPFGPMRSIGGRRTICGL